MPDKRTMMNECWTCVNKCTVPGNCHIRCIAPDAEMTGDSYGRSQGWFIYPLLFDPTWKTKLCSNYQTTVEEAVTIEAHEEENKGVHDGHPRPEGL